MCTKPDLYIRQVFRGLLARGLGGYALSDLKLAEAGRASWRGLNVSVGTPPAWEELWRRLIFSFAGEPPRALAVALRVFCNYLRASSTPDPPGPWAPCAMTTGLCGSVLNLGQDHTWIFPGTALLQTRENRRTREVLVIFARRTLERRRPARAIYRLCRARYPWESEIPGMAATDASIVFA